MNEHHFIQDEWKIIEEGFDPSSVRASESIFSLGNGKMGQRANFEEDYSGDSLRGHYVAGIYYPDKTKVGWWKVGYPEYFAKILNAPNWIGIRVIAEGTSLDLARLRPLSFRRELDMRHGILLRRFTVVLPGGKELAVESIRFLSMADDETAAIRYTLTALRGTIDLEVIPYLDADVRNEEANYGEKFWQVEKNIVTPAGGIIQVRTRKLDFRVSTGITCDLSEAGRKKEMSSWQRDHARLSRSATLTLKEGEKAVLHKFAVIVSSLYYEPDEMPQVTERKLKAVVDRGFDRMLQDHKEVWKRIWQEKDFVIRGDLAAQQGIRFNIFQLQQTYTGKDERLNIGPKGFTGEKYGGSTYWDTEAFAFPYYLYSGSREIARNLLLYRYRHLPKAIENAKKLGFKDGAALYPMVTMNGEECHNEWEITFEEIHRNGAIAYAIYQFTRYTGSHEYLFRYGLEVLIALSRFWSQRVNWSEEKKKFVILGVTGPNEYENNVNNNWYTNYLARWTLQYTLESIEHMRREEPESWKRLKTRTSFRESEETGRWQKIIDNLFLPEDPKRRIFLQQDGFLDKELRTVDELDPSELPLNQHWSWDRILRSCFIKQADVLQGLYFFEEHFDTATVRRNFDFYEPMTVHESSLSPCVHSILSSRTGDLERAYRLYLRTSRLDLDDYNKEVSEGLHITSMAGTWLALVEGFAGMKIRDRQLFLEPRIPQQWESYAFMIRFHDHLLHIRVTHTGILIEQKGSTSLTLYVQGDQHNLPPEVEVSIPLKI